MNAENGTATYGHNFMSDWTREEFQKLLGYKNTIKTSNPSDLDSMNLARSVNWVTKGFVTPVKYQGQCVAGYAFSAIGAIESAEAIAGAELTNYSVQQILDCDEDDKGFGNMDGAFKYASKTPIETEEDYPYIAKTMQKCKYQGTGVVILSGFTDVKQKSIRSLKVALMKGPVSVAIEADTGYFHRYTGGIINSKMCGTTLDHGVLAVGYDKDPSTGTPYFLVKNSWGTSWGVDGYVKIAAT